VIVDDGTSNALISNPGTGLGNSAWGPTAPDGPLRVGIFAASAVTNNREETGSAFFGVMELSGNLFERCVGVGNPESRAFTGNHGDGELSSAGEADVTDWPGDCAWRGGSWIDSEVRLLTGDRWYANIHVFNYTSFSTAGIRGVRTAE
jgi:hypothetical protein